jgi:hypothetical protein
MRPRLSHRSKNYALWFGTVDASDGGSNARHGRAGETDFEELSAIRREHSCCEDTVHLAAWRDPTGSVRVRCSEPPNSKRCRRRGNRAC